MRVNFEVQSSHYWDEEIVQIATPIRGIYTAEANMDAERFRRDKKNFLDLKGKNIRPTEKDFVQVLYSLSKPPIVQLEDPN